MVYTAYYKVAAMKTDDSITDEFLDDLSKMVEAVLIEYSVDDDIAEQSAAGVVDRMVELWGGQQFYFCKGHRTFIAKRDLMIYSDFNHRNHRLLARKYKLSVQTIYKIIKRVERANFDRRQCALDFPPAQ